VTIENIALGLGALSLLVSVVAVWIAISSDRRMRALSNLEFQEKLAAMAGHLNAVKQDKSPLRAERIRNDLVAVSSLQEYAPAEEQEKLIRDYVIPILKEYLGTKMDQGVAITVKEIIEIALSYGIESSELGSLRQRARGLG
jgi:hypothetical protein